MLSQAGYACIYRESERSSEQAIVHLTFRYSPIYHFSRLTQH